MSERQPIPNQEPDNNESRELAELIIGRYAEIARQHNLSSNQFQRLLLQIQEEIRDQENSFKKFKGYTMSDDKPERDISNTEPFVLPLHTVNTGKFQLGGVREPVQETENIDKLEDGNRYLKSGNYLCSFSPETYLQIEEEADTEGTTPEVFIEPSIKTAIDSFEEFSAEIGLPLSGKETILLKYSHDTDSVQDYDEDMYIEDMGGITRPNTEISATEPFDLCDPVHNIFLGYMCYEYGGTQEAMDPQALTNYDDIDDDFDDGDDFSLSNC